MPPGAEFYYKWRVYYGAHVLYIAILRNLHGNVDCRNEIAVI